MNKSKHFARGSCLTAILLATLAIESGGMAYAQSDEASSMTFITNREVPHLDRSQNSGGNILTNNLMDPLIKVAANGEIHPGLIDSWEQIDEGRMRLTLRQDVTFSNGEKFNAEALKVNMERWFDVSIFNNLRGVSAAEVVDEYTVDLVHEPQSQMSLLSELGLFVFMFSPRQITEDPDSLQTAPISTGPYKIVNYEPGREALLVAREDYWGNDVEGWGAPSIKNVTVRWGVDPGVGLAALQAGEVDLVQQLTPENAALLSEDMRVIRPSPEMFFLRFGFKDKFTSDPRVREAINLAIDREALNAPFLGMGEPATQIWHSQVAGWTERDQVEPDLERAKELIKEAGADGAEMQMVFSTPYKTGIGLVSQVVAAMIEDTGIKVKMTDMDGTRFREYIRKLDDTAPLSTISIGYDGPAAPDFAAGRISCTGTLSTYCNEEVDQLLQMARNATGAEENREILQEMMDLIEEDLGVIPLISPPLIWGKSADLNVTPSFGDTMEWKDWTRD